MAIHRGKGAGQFQKQMRSLREDGLTQVTCALLLARGCGDVRVEEVAAECGVAKGTCYQHFETRGALLTAAVRYLDEALAKQLLSPPAHITSPREVFEWAVLEAIDAELLTLAQRNSQAKLNADALEGRAWPCCLGLMPCPYGGAVRSLEALRRWSTRLTSRRDARAFDRVTLLLAFPPCYVFGLGHRSRSAVNPRTVRSVGRQLLKLLFP